MGTPVAKIQKLPTSRWRDYKALRLEALKADPLAFGGTPEEEAKVKEKEWKKRMKNARFAMVGEEPVGMIVSFFNKETKFRHIVEIYSFYVKARFRGEGIGTALLDHALRTAKKNSGIEKARLYVNAQQRRALRMYEKAGFTVVGRLLREMKVGNQFYTMLIMEKRIR